jgi:hypothetical protein
MIPNFQFFAFVGEQYAITISKILVITIMKVFLIARGFDYDWRSRVEGEATEKNPLIEGMVSCPSVPWRRSLMKEYVKLPV